MADDYACEISVFILQGSPSRLFLVPGSCEGKEHGIYKGRESGPGVRS